jgi:RNA polymerase sigma-70 factor, ECF subfamily
LMGEERRQFEETFLPFLDAAYNLARWIVQHDQDAQDVVQEAYLRAFKGYQGFRGGNGRAWLLTIVRNTAYSWINKHAADGRLVPYEEEKHAEVISFDQSTREIVTEKRKEYLQNALSRLPVEYREVILLYEFEGLSYKELADALGIPVGTVMSRLSRARRRLQQEFTHIRDAEAVNEL